MTLAAHGLRNDDAVVFRTSGGLPTGLTVGTVYYVVNKATDTFKVAATVGGAAINTSSAGSGTHSVATGKDTHDGSAADRTHALLTIHQAAQQLAAALDSSLYDVTLQLAKSFYDQPGPRSKPWPAPAPSSSSGTRPRPAIARSTSPAPTPSMVGVPTTYRLKGMQFLAPAEGPSAHAASRRATSRCRTSTFPTGFPATSAPPTREISITGNYTISAGTGRTLGRRLRAHPRPGTITITRQVPPHARPLSPRDSTPPSINVPGNTYTGAATGTRYTLTMNSVCNVGGGGANYFPGNAAGSTATGAQYA